MSASRMPVLFVGHGSPWNAVADNAYTRDLRALAGSLPQPAAVAVISAHWLTRGFFVTASPRPDQIFDFVGFPDRLYRVFYRAPGSPETAEAVAGITGGKVSLHVRRGIDHAAWAVLAHLFPSQDVPVIEISVDPGLGARRHLALGALLRPLRERGVLFLGSGNIVHNLAEVDFDDDAAPCPWAAEFDSFARDALEARDAGALVDYGSHPLAKKAVPTSEHYLPMVTALGLMEEGDEVVTVHESIQNATISMRSFMLDRLDGGE